MQAPPLKQARKAPSYASSKLRLTQRLTGVKCRATSVAKKLLKRDKIGLIGGRTRFCKGGDFASICIIH